MALKAPSGADHPFKLEILRMIREFDASRPRSLQKHLGPSEVGSGCTRQLAYKLAGRPEVNQTSDPWFPIIGTAVHAWLATAMGWYNDVYLDRAGDPRFLLENRVKVAAQGSGYDTSGHTDVYDADYERVVDWKIVGTTTMRKVEKEGSTQQYRVQGNTYGAGWVQAGFPVKEIMIAYLPRSNFLNKMKLDVMPFEPHLAHEALARVGAIEQLVKAGVAPESLPAADCTIWCPFFTPGKPLTGFGCPGHGDAKDD